MQSIIFVFYLLLFVWLITIIPFFKQAGIGKWVLIFLFLIKIAAGFVYARFYSLPQNVANADTWKFYHASLTETDWLLRDPWGFIKDYFHSPYKETSGLFSGVSSYWNDLDYNTFVKGMAVINVFTGRNYYANIIIYNFIFLFGPVALYRLAQPLWKHNKFILIAAIFLLPSFLFWCSGLHKDGLIFSAIIISLYGLQKQIQEQRFVVKYCLLILLCFLLLFALRNVILLLLLPALAAFFISEKKPHYQWLIFTGIYTTGLLLFFMASYLSPALQFPQYIISKQAEFNALNGNSKIVLPPLEPSFISFIKFSPSAIDLTFFRPHITELKSITYSISFLENSFIMLCIFIWFVFHKQIKNTKPLLLFLLFFSLSILLICGYTVTFTGAIVRYKSIATPLLLTFLLLSINFEKSVFTKLIK